MKTISLKHGAVAIVDDEDYELLIRYSWLCQQGGSTLYASRRSSFGKSIYMHREILSVPKGLQVDHKNGNGLDNRRENLRLATSSQNNWNRAASRNNSSGYKCVYWHAGAWEVQIQANKRRLYLGRFSALDDARDAYADAARRLHGEFMHL